MTFSEKIILGKTKHVGGRPRVSGFTNVTSGRGTYARPRWMPANSRSYGFRSNRLVGVLSRAQQLSYFGHEHPGRCGAAVVAPRVLLCGREAVCRMRKLHQRVHRRLPNREREISAAADVRTGNMQRAASDAVTECADVQTIRLRCRPAPSARRGRGDGSLGGMGNAV